MKQLESVKAKYTYQTPEKEIESDFNLAFNNIQDLFRINIEINEKKFEKGAIHLLKVIKCVNDISLNNNFPVPFKNSFANNGGCKDFKVLLIYKKYSLEVQIHTKESENMNLNTHGIYEVFRTLEDGTEEKELLREDRDKLFSTVLSPSFDSLKIMKEVFDYGE